jgi:two-component system chemotaxis response regulator CheY
VLKPQSKILVVDDLGTIRSLLKDSLKKLGFKSLKEAENGKEALRMLKEAADANEGFELVISDWNMPVMTGLELLEARNADDRLKPIPFLMVTIESEAQYVLKAASKGVSDFIVKPFTPQTLEQKIKGIFERLKK